MMKRSSLPESLPGSRWDKASVKRVPPLEQLLMDYWSKIEAKAGPRPAGCHMSKEAGQ